MYQYTAVEICLGERNGIGDTLVEWATSKNFTITEHPISETNVRWAHGSLLVMFSFLLSMLV